VTVSNRESSTLLWSLCHDNRFESSSNMAEAVEFEHFIGINTIPKCTHFHPNGQKYIFSSGASLVIGDLIDAHTQEFLRQHDDAITAIAVSSSGRMIASGQQGENSDVIIWDFETKKVMHTLEEHDYRVQDIAFSDDEKLVVTIGNEEDGKMIIWDLSNGCIVSSCGKLALGTTFVCFAGYVKDIKRRNTSHYLLCSAGADGIVLWDLDPYSGDLLPLKLLGEARATITRQVTAVSFSDDKEYLYGATTSGDFIVGSVRSNKIVQVIQATKMQLSAILYHSTGVVIGCGDASIKMYTHAGEFQGQLKLDGPVINLSSSPDRLEVTRASFGLCKSQCLFLIYHDECAETRATVN
jgi:WD40 repeat protein